MSLDYDAFYHARMERYAYCESPIVLPCQSTTLSYCLVTVAAFLGYEYCKYLTPICFYIPLTMSFDIVLQFSNEVDLFWVCMNGT